MRAIRLYNEETGKERFFKTIADAASAIGVGYSRVRDALVKKRKCGDYVVTEVSAYEIFKRDIDLDPPRQELDIPHYATIDGIKFVAVKCTDKTHCCECDIYKLDPPLSMGESPLCYDYSCGNQKIVSICARYKCIWKKKTDNPKHQ